MGTKFVWIVKCKESFQLLKELLTSAPISKMEGPNQYYVVSTHEWKKDLGGVLTYNVISYELR